MTKSVASTVSVQDMLQAGMHFGHRPSKKHPKMDRFVFGVKQGINVIDLEHSKTQLDAILPIIEEMAANNKTILFLGTKRQAKAIVQKAAQRAGMPYIVERWLGGLLTNYGHVSHLMKKLTQLKEEQTQGVWQERYTKKEALMLEREMINLTQEVGGIETLTKLPDAIFVVDCKKEKTAIKEANRLKIPVIAMVDTNVNPDKVQYPIPANDDGVKSITLVAEAVADAIVAGRARAVVVEAPTVVARKQA